MTQSKKITVPKLLSNKTKNNKLVMVTAYDATFARLIDQSKVDIILVGDSLGMVIQGHESTIPVTLEDMIYHCRAVSRGVTRAHICGDMPFMTNKISPEKSLEAATRLIQEGRAESVKLEGGVEMADTIHKIVSAGIPVVGHVGLTPQSVHAFGGFKIQGKKGFDQVKIVADAKAVADAGAFCIVLEGIPMELAQTISSQVPVPTIGIGAGPHCDGQVLVIYDLLGMNEQFTPKFLKKYANVAKITQEAISAFGNEVRTGIFPSLEHSVSAKKAPTLDEAAIYGSLSSQEKK